MNENTKRFLTSQLVWLVTYFGIAVAVTVLLPLPFPYSFFVLLAVIIPLSLYRRRRYLRRLRRGEDSFFNSGGILGPKGVDYYCINCGTKHRQIACPNCGSKMKKAGFGS